jgi:hypothetical protein
MKIENLIRYTPRAVGLMEIEHLFRYTALAVGLKPSAMECKARLRGLWRIISSKTINHLLTAFRRASTWRGRCHGDRREASAQARFQPPA